MSGNGHNPFQDDPLNYAKPWVQELVASLSARKLSELQDYFWTSFLFIHKEVLKAQSKRRRRKKP